MNEASSRVIGALAICVLGCVCLMVKGSLWVVFMGTRAAGSLVKVTTTVSGYLCSGNVWAGSLSQ